MESKENQKRNITLAILGCGNLGYAILQGLVASYEDDGMKDEPAINFLICVQTEKQAIQLSRKSPFNWPLGSSYYLKILVAKNIEGFSQADVIVLACPPSQAAMALGADGVLEALSGKLLISMMGGVSLPNIESALYTGSNSGPEPCHIIRAVTNIAAAVSTGVNIIAERTASIPPETLALGKYLLGRIGNVVEVRADQMPAATALGASGTAFFALMLEASVDGAVAQGLSHDQALKIAAQTMAGVAKLVLSGRDPAIIRSQVTTPGGSTARGLAALEDGAVRGKIIRAIEQTAGMHSK